MMAIAMSAQMKTLCHHQVHLKETHARTLPCKSLHFTKKISTGLTHPDAARAATTGFAVGIGQGVIGMVIKQDNPAGQHGKSGVIRMSTEEKS
jgi:hypothetical protein